MINISFSEILTPEKSKMTGNERAREIKEEVFSASQGCRVEAGKDLWLRAIKPNPTATRRHVERAGERFLINCWSWNSYTYFSSGILLRINCHVSSGEELSSSGRHGETQSRCQTVPPFRCYSDALWVIAGEHLIDGQPASFQRHSEGKTCHPGKVQWTRALERG